MAGKTLRYEHCDNVTQNELDKSRATEWQTWKDFGAGVKRQGKELQDLLAEGHKPIPTQWIETCHDGEYKSRLVACGQYEDRTDIRSDAPTCSLEVFNIIVSFAASNRLKLKSADLRNAYFQGEKMDRLLLLRPPRSGLPDEDGDFMLAANVPIYGTGDAGRKFYKGFRAQAIAMGLRERRFARSCYT